MAYPQESKLIREEGTLYMLRHPLHVALIREILLKEEACTIKV